MNIGRDIMGTMANTLVLAYIGSALSVTLLLIAYNSSMQALLNREMIIVEILNALAGSIGILLTIPLTSFICALLYTRQAVKTAPPAEAEELPKDMPKEMPKSFFSLDKLDEDSYDEL